MHILSFEMGCTVCIPTILLLIAVVIADPQEHQGIRIQINGPARVVGNVDPIDDPNNGQCSSCCVSEDPVSTAEQCTAHDGFCVPTGGRCKTTIKTLYNRYNDYCICCIPEKQVECSFPWVQIGTGCFQFVLEYETWDSARQRCLDLGGDLAVLDTKSKRIDIMNYVEQHYDVNRRSYLKRRSYWLGGHDRSGSWSWITGGAVTAGWRVPSGQPDDDSGDNTCLYTISERTYGTDDILFDIRCSYPMKDFICEK